MRGGGAIQVQVVKFVPWQSNLLGMWGKGAEEGNKPGVRSIGRSESAHGVVLGRLCAAFPSHGGTEFLVGYENFRPFFFLCFPSLIVEIPPLGGDSYDQVVPLGNAALAVCGILLDQGDEQNPLTAGAVCKAAPL